MSKAEIDARRASIVNQVGGEKGLPQALVSANIASVDLDAYLELLILSDKVGQAAQAAGVHAASRADAEHSAGVCRPEGDSTPPGRLGDRRGD